VTASQQPATHYVKYKGPGPTGRAFSPPRRAFRMRVAGRGAYRRGHSCRRSIVL